MDVSGSRLLDAGAIAVAEGLARGNGTLRDVNLYNCSIGAEGALKSMDVYSVCCFYGQSA